jgi:cyclopropane-fatty-acyl-phospholipid synthase
MLATPTFLGRELDRIFPERPFEVEFWDGSRLASTAPGGPVFRVVGPGAISHVLRSPGQLGIGRAYVSGLIEVDDLDAAMSLLASWKPPALDAAARVRLALAAIPAVGLTAPARVPEIELRPRGKRHSILRDRRAVRHHYDVSNEFFALFLDESMSYSCALFSHGAGTLEEAQEAKRELVCQKLGLEPGQRVLDVGCGWGSFVIHAAVRHGVHALGITLSEPQAQLARERVSAAGLDGQVEIRVADYRELGEESFDAIASIGMVEHVGSVQIDDYAARLAALLGPGGRLLNHGIARLRHGDPEAGPFSERYVFPDAAPLHLARVLAAVEQAGLVTQHVEGLAGDYIETLNRWIARFDQHLDRAVELAGAERVRVFRLYLRAARNGFRVGFTGVYQVLARRPAPDAGPSF